MHLPSALSAVAMVGAKNLVPTPRATTVSASVVITVASGGELELAAS